MTSSSKPVSCSIKAGVGGQYKITAVVTDDAGGQEPQRDHALGERCRRGARRATSSRKRATVVPDKEHYRPGDTAQLLVDRAVRRWQRTAHRLGQRHDPHADTSCSTTARRSSKVPIADTDTPGLTVQVDLAGQAPQTPRRRTKDLDAPARRPSRPHRLPLHVRSGERDVEGVAPSRARRVTEPGATDTVDVSVEGRRRGRGRGRRRRGRRRGRSRVVADRIQARGSDRDDVRGADRRTTGRLPPQQPGVGEPGGVR